MNKTLMIISCNVLLSSTTMANVVEFVSIEDWAPAVVTFETINFTGFSNGTIITNQFEPDGVLFTDGTDLVINNATSFPLDGWGLRGGTSGFADLIHIAFATPQHAIAAFYPGGMRIELYRDNTLIYTSAEFGGKGTNLFAGIVSSESFDGVVLSDWVDNTAFIDDLLFSSVPAPGAMGLLGLMAFVPHRKRT